ncbi:MAG: 50S ribosomal protein L24 [Waddliaceae bacterium]|jgi:large subunit ribosomal protein L24|nr:50S ribosomal protein L24 [Waddliaceae bacterium]MBT3578649.1 50S ribosomal protein L24 [Waddliaceae bacterium]MBT4445368.1 50S ribosomal protein L24 [Waddliaceae bacterium]MBT6928364.1 50S ribosomal protein L24 [Waddliaceae bacterium]MBT7265050.1 50S ribosomal protein L24 [Waddliaceae bacterium]
MKTTRKKRPVVQGNKKLRVGDRVVVIAGNDKGRTGTILSRKGDDRLVVQGINVRKKHTKATQQGPGSIIDIEVSINASNVKLCPTENKGVKLAVRVNKNKERELFYRDGDKDVVYRSVKKDKKK